MADLMHWRALTAAIEDIKAAPSFILDLLFKGSEPHASQYLDVDVTVGGRKLAPFVRETSPATQLDKLGQKLRSYKFPMIRVKKEISASELLTPRAPGAELYVKGGVENYKRKRLALELEDLKNRVDRTIEYMACQALQGELVVEQDDLAFTIDFLVPDANKYALSGDTTWGGSSAEIIGDFRTAKRLVGKSGKPADVAILGSDAVELLLADEDIQKLLDNRRVAIGELGLQSGNYIGRIAGLDLYEYLDEYTDDAGDDAAMVPADTVIVTSTRARFTRHFGVILDLDSDAASTMPYFAKSWVEKDPSVQWLLAAASPLPVPHNPDAIVVVEVC